MLVVMTFATLEIVMLVEVTWLAFEQYESSSATSYIVDFCYG